jgi:hypothetical protein
VVDYKNQFESIREDVLDLYVQDEPIKVLNLDVDHEATAGQFGTATVLVYGVNSSDWPARGSEAGVKYDLVTVFGSLPLDDSKHEFLCACDKVMNDHGRVLMNFDYGTFEGTCEGVGHFVRYVSGCNFVVESYKEFWGRGTSRFVLKKDFGQGHCANVKPYILD